MIQYTKLNNGTWGIKSTVELVSGQEIVVSKANGTETKEIVAQGKGTKSYSSYNGYGDYSTQVWYIYTIQKKYKKGISNNPSTLDKPIVGNKQKKKSYNKQSHKYTSYNKEPIYDLFVWKYSYTGNPPELTIDQSNPKNWELETELKGIGKEQATQFVSLYENKNDYIALSKYRSSGYEDSVTQYDICNVQFNNQLLAKLLLAYYAKNEIEENKEKLWISCRMTCATFPARSQKIKGILELTSYVKKCVDYSAIENAGVVTYNDDIENVIHKCNQIGTYSTGNNNRRTKLDAIIPDIENKFMRPCPQNPEHGFVDSRLVKNKQDIEEVIEEIKKTGEIPEFIVMGKIACDYSGVITPDRVVFGKGNDGATSGKDAIEIPLEIDNNARDMLRKYFWNNNELYCVKCHITYNQDNNIKASATLLCSKCTNKLERKWPFVEVLYQSIDKPTIVQLRAGPELKVDEENVKVKYVYDVDSSMDLIEFGKVSKKLAQDIENSSNGSYNRITPVCWHPGGALSSHFGVHCKETKIPYLTSGAKPSKDEIIKVGSKNSTNIQAIKEGLILGLETPINAINYTDITIKNWLKNFLGSLHMYALADLGNEEVARYIGYSWSIGARIISALPFGECSHKHEAKMACMNAISGYGNASAFPTSERDYVRMWAIELEPIISGLIACYRSFLDYKWSSSYGGKAWAGCTLALIEVFIGIREVIKKADNNNMTILLDSVNKMVNMAHNNGWWLNKLLRKEDFDKAALLPHFSLHPSVAFRCREDYGKVKEFVLKVKGFKLASSIVVDQEILDKKIISAEVMSSNCPSCKIEGTYNSVFKSGLCKHHYDLAKANPFIEEIEPTSDIPTYNQDELKAMIIVDSKIEGQHKSDSNVIHIQIKCMNINREYGYSGTYYSNNSIYNIGEVVGSLTLSGNTYNKCNIYKSNKESYLIIEVETPSSTKNYAIVQDSIIYDSIMEIQKYQIVNNAIVASLEDAEKIYLEVKKDA